ncbi:hypothetical protein V6Z12_D03G112400 [Gossypium hirsutum]
MTVALFTSGEYASPGARYVTTKRVHVSALCLRGNKARDKARLQGRVLLTLTLHNLQLSQKKEAAKQCDCTLLDVENALAKFTWAKEVHKKMVKLKEEGKPMPKNFAKVQKLMGSTPLDLAKFNMVKSGEMSRNAPCPCGSKNRYKRCCGKDP